MKFQILKKLIEGYRGIKDLQTNEEYDVLTLHLKLSADTHNIAQLKIDVTKDGTLHLNSDEFELKRCEPFSMCYDLILRENLASMLELQIVERRERNS